jgi:hypothetical protein
LLLRKPHGLRATRVPVGSVRSRKFKSAGSSKLSSGSHAEAGQLLLIRTRTPESEKPASAREQDETEDCQTVAVRRGLAHGQRLGPDAARHSVPSVD